MTPLTRNTFEWTHGGLVQRRSNHVRVRLSVGLVLFTVVLLLSGCELLGGRKATQIYSPKYAQDGRGVYYIQEYDKGVDDWVFETRYVSTVGAESSLVSADAAGVPSGVTLEGDTLAVPLLSDSPDGRMRLSTDSSAGRDDTATLSVLDARTARPIRTLAWSRGLVTSVGWLDNRTLLVGVSMRQDGSAGLELVDVTTGHSISVLSVPARGEDSAASVDRIIVDPAGFALVDVTADSLMVDSQMYVYDVATHTARKDRTVAPLGSWDYSPTRKTVVTLDPSDWNRLLEFKVGSQ